MRNICVIGLGYIGLPTAAMFATHGYRVIGVDTNERIVRALWGGQVPIQEPGLQEIVHEALQSGNLTVAGAPQPADAFVIAVPTPCTHARPAEPIGRRPEADLACVASAAEAIVPHLRPGNLVILESTVPPRTTRDTLAAIVARSGLPIAADGQTPQAASALQLAHCPERVLPGRILEELVHNDRIIGGLTTTGAERAGELYASFVEGDILTTDATTAEMVKLMENTFRDVNIALANEFAQVAERIGVDVWQAIALANHHPRVKILKPGPGVGGHCIAVDPWFIAQVAPDATPLIQAARAINDGMAAHVTGLVKQAVQGRERPAIACLGLSYKAEVDDVRESPSLHIIQQLRAAGLDVRAFDPHVTRPQAPALAGIVAPTLAAALAGADCAVILTDHAEFRALTPAHLAPMRNPVVVDTRNCLDASIWGAGGQRLVLGTGLAV